MYFYQTSLGGPVLPGPILGVQSCFLRVTFVQSSLQAQLNTS